jgi:hypothetical protein
MSFGRKQSILVGPTRTSTIWESFVDAGNVRTVNNKKPRLARARSLCSGRRGSCAARRKIGLPLSILSRNSKKWTFERQRSLLIQSLLGDGGVIGVRKGGTSVVRCSWHQIPAIESVSLNGD